MSALLAALGRPDVKAVMEEFFALENSGVARVTDPAALADLRGVIRALFGVVGTMLQTFHALRGALEFDDNDAAGAAPQDYAAYCQQAEELCTGSAMPQTVVALYLLRAKLRALGPDANEEHVVRLVHETVALLIPGVSLLDVWQENRAQCAQLWTCLTDLLRVMDACCPDAAAGASAAVAGRPPLPPPPPLPRGGE